MRGTAFCQDISRWFDEAMQDGNPMLTAWLAVAAEEESACRLLTTDREAWVRRIAEGRCEHIMRRALVGQYAWAVPDKAALDLLARVGPIVEIGAGAGYWAWLLRKRGVDVVAYDAEPPRRGSEINNWHKDTPTWTVVDRGGAGSAANHADRTLLLCWPPYDDPMAADALKAFAGRRVVFVGESEGGCTANDEFFELLDRDFDCAADVEIPQFDGMHDRLSLWERKDLQ